MNAAIANRGVRKEKTATTARSTRDAHHVRSVLLNPKTVHDRRKKFGGIELVAKETGISYSILREVEGRGRKITPRQAEQIAKVLKCTVPELCRAPSRIHAVS